MLQKVKKETLGHILKMISGKKQDENTNDLCEWTYKC